MKPRKKTLWRSENGKATLIQRPPEVVRISHIDGPAHMAAFSDDVTVYRLPMPWTVYGFVINDTTVEQACVFATSGPVTSGYDLLLELPLPNLLSGGWSAKTPYNIMHWTDIEEAELSAFINLMVDSPFSSDDLGNIHDAYADVKPLKLMRGLLDQPHSTKNLFANWQLWSDVSGLDQISQWDWHPAWHDVSIIDELIAKLYKLQSK